MSLKDCATGAAVLVTSSVALATVAAAQPPPIGAEFQVNTSTVGEQSYPAVARDDDGDFVVAWSGQPLQGGGGPQDVFFQRFGANGSRRGGVVQANAGNGGDPAVAMDGSDRFIVAWRSYDFDQHTGSILARRFNGNGSSIGGVFQVSTHTTGLVFWPTAAAAGDGDFVIAWVNSLEGARARVFDASAAPKGPVFQVDDNPYGSTAEPHAAMDGDGDFVIVWWELAARDGEGSGIFARRFDDDGLPHAPAFQVNVFTPSTQMEPAAAMEADGSFVIVWLGPQMNAYQQHVIARRFDSTGEGVATEFQVDLASGYPPQTPDVAMDAGGGFAVAWKSTRYNIDSPRGIYARRYDSDGTPKGGEFQVNSFSLDKPSFPALAMDAHGSAVVVWQSERDGDGDGIFAQLFADVIAFDLDGNGSFGALTDALILLRYGFGFRGDALLAGAFDEVSCTRCSAQEIEAFIDGLGAVIDIDGNGQVGALTDGLSALRWAFGFRGDALVSGVVGAGCTRCSASDIQSYLAIWAD